MTDLFRRIGNDVTLPRGDGSPQSRKVRLGQLLRAARDRVFDVEVAEDGSAQPMRLSIRGGDKKQGACQ
ncbi:MAG: hypothetical protein HOP29_19175 [Phycisphaerales bacterium]|nr:hypothetical protein [Phycisphaerales bacterium]